MGSFDITDSLEPALRTGPRVLGRSQGLRFRINGRVITLAAAPTRRAWIVRNFVGAVGELARLPMGKTTVSASDEGHELVLERRGTRAWISLIRPGADPQIMAYDEPLSFDELVGLARTQLATIPQGEEMVPLLARVAPGGDDDIDPVDCDVSTDRGADVAFGADFRLRPACPGQDTSVEVQRSDMHAVLFPGQLHAVVRGKRVALGTAPPFLFAEQLAALAVSLLDGWERGLRVQLRSPKHGILLGAKLAEKNEISLVLGPAAPGAIVSTFPRLDLFTFVDAALAFGRGLIRAVVRRDRAQASNLRIIGTRRTLAQLADRVRELTGGDVRVNPEPETYRAHAPRIITSAKAPTRLAYQPKWRALVPSIDLRATFLCGDKLIVGGRRETYCLDRDGGDTLWRLPTTRATSVVTPMGLARIHPEGNVDVHDYRTGLLAMQCWTAPRTGGACVGAVVNAPELPRMLIVTEGQSHLVAIDLTTGEMRWRFVWGKGGAPKLRRAGKLLYVTSGDTALTAIDVTTGALVWRARDKLRFAQGVSVDGDVVYALTGGTRASCMLRAFDAYSGRDLFHVEVSPVAPLSFAVPDALPFITKTEVIVTQRTRECIFMRAYDRALGLERWSLATPAPAGTSWMVVDDLLLGNAPTGELVAVDAESGTIRYRHDLGPLAESDTPRRLEPILRSGALFVPHADVHVFKPSDGTKIGTVAPTDTIPDFLRVDERCDVYLAEESGHVACFAAGTRLSIVS